MTNLEANGIVSEELLPEEELLWSGNSDPVQSMRGYWPVFVFGVFWIVAIVAIIVIYGISDIAANTGMQGITAYLLFFPFLAIGFGMMLAPLFVYRSAKTTAYGLTDQRILIIRAARTRFVEEYRKDEIEILTRTERSDGSGTIMFSGPTFNKNRRRSVRSSGFYGVQDVREVDRLMRQQTGSRT